MLKKIKNIALGLLVGSLVFLGNINQGLAQTTITPNGCGYQVKVAAAFYFKDKSAQSQADQLLSKWQQGIAKIWGNANQFKIGTSSCPVQFNFDLKKIPASQSCADFPEYHCITVVADAKNQRGNVADVTLAIANSKGNSNGEWSINTSELDASHEIGHLLGLSDEYHVSSQDHDLLELCNFDQITEPGQFWATGGATNLQFDSNSKQAGLAALSFDLNAGQNSDNAAQIGSIILKPVLLGSYQDLYLSGWVFLPQASVIKSINLNVGAENQGGLEADLNTDWQGNVWADGWNKLEVKVDKMIPYGSGLANQAINTLVIRLNYQDIKSEIKGFKLDNFNFGINKKLWQNDNQQTVGPQSIMAQTWGDVAVLPQDLAKIIAHSR